MIDSLSTNTYRVIVTVLYRFACNILSIHKIGLDCNTRLSSISFRRTIQTLQKLMGSSSLSTSSYTPQFRRIIDK